MRPRELLGPLKVSLGLALALEIGLRVVAGMGWVALVAGDVHGFDRMHRGPDVPLEERLYESDRDLIFRMRPNLRAIFPRVALFPGQPVSYSVETNEHGFRTQAFSETKAPGIFRVIALGDSSTFGMSVDGASAYPNVLAKLLEVRMPGRFEVLNLGVPGYSSRQGLELIRRKVLHYQPDLVTFSYGTNGRFHFAAATDDANIRLNQSALGGAAIALKLGLDHFYIYRLVRKLVATTLYRLIDTGASQATPQRRIELDGIRDAISAAHAELARAGAELIVINADFMRTDAREGMKRGVAATGAGYLDMRDLFDQTRLDRSRRIEAEEGLPAAKPSDEHCLMRVRAPDSSVVSLEWQPFLSGTLSIDPMSDDGSNGDQVAGDGIWSLRIPLNPLQPGQTLLYAYWQTEAGEELREFKPGAYLGGRYRGEIVPESGIMEIDDFGVYFLHTDAAHPDEEGHRLIAEALLPSVLEIERRSH